VSTRLEQALARLLEQNSPASIAIRCRILSQLFRDDFPGWVLNEGQKVSLLLTALQSKEPAVVHEVLVQAGQIKNAHPELTIELMNMVQRGEGSWSTRHMIFDIISKHNYDAVPHLYKHVFELLLHYLQVGDEYAPIAIQALKEPK
jgi:hypothetical protein